jgi:hypothetical protein
MYKVYHSRKPKLQQQAIRFKAWKLNPTSLPDWTLRERLLHRRSSAEQVQDVLHNAPKTFFLRVSIAFTHRDRRLKITR